MPITIPTRRKYRTGAFKGIRRGKSDMNPSNLPKGHPAAKHNRVPTGRPGTFRGKLIQGMPNQHKVGYEVGA